MSTHQTTTKALKPPTAPPREYPKGPRFSMNLSATWRTDYPEEMLRTWAMTILGAERINNKYMEALRVVLGNMALADRLGSRLWIGQQYDFINRASMRTLLAQLHGARLVRRLAGAMLYQGAPRSAPLPEGADLYELLQRETEAAHFMRFRASIGLCVGDVPY